jgi:glycosyltransferase involved in cell wall biosynthesis
MKKVIWLGPAFTITEALTSPALAPAASRWQEGFLGGLRDAGAELRIVASRSERVWPLGPLWIRGDEGAFHGIHRSSVSFVNLPGVREPSLAARYQRALCTASKEMGGADLIASYNVWKPVAQACRSESRRLGVPWVPILLDYDRTAADWTDFAASTAGAAGIVFVSHWAFQHAPASRKLHLDAGVARVPAALPRVNRSRMILYTGALHRWGGIETLLDALPLVQTPGVRLTIVGRGGDTDLHSRLNTTPALNYLGGVDEPTLERLTAEAEVLLNPRPAGVPGNEMNFPSKLLHYLSSLKPVATTLTPGVAPEYRDVVIAAEDDSPAAFAAAIDRALGLSDIEKGCLAHKIQEFLTNGRLWCDQACRFLDWAAGVAGREEIHLQRDRFLISAESK